MNKHHLKPRASSGRLSRRDFLTRTTMALTAAGVPWFIPARALGRDGAVAPSEKIVLGGIGLGPRGQYDLSVMLPEKDVQFVAICDVARSRREQVKQMVDAHYGNQDCRMYRDMFELLARPDIDAVLIATGDHWHALASLARRQSRQGRLQRETVRNDHRRDPVAGGRHPSLRAGLPGGHPAAERQQFSICRPPGAKRQAGAAPHPARLGLCALQELRLAARRTGAAQGRVRLGPLARAGALAALQQPLCQRRLARPSRFRGGRQLPRLGRPHRGPVPVGQPGRPHHAHRVRGHADLHHRPATPTASNWSATSCPPPSATATRNTTPRPAPARSGSKATKAGSKPATTRN